MNLIQRTPQDIFLKLRPVIAGYTEVTVERWATVYIPNGAGVFNKVVTTSINILQSGAIGTYSGQVFAFISDSGKHSKTAPISEVTAGPTEPGNGYTYWYDTTNNIIKYSSQKNNIWTIPSRKLSLPIAIYTRTNGVASSIDRVFDGFGYIGNTLFVVPGVVEKIPSGRDINGDAYFQEISVNKVLTNNNYNGEYAYLKGKNGIANEIIVSESELKYNDTSNIFSDINCAVFYYNYSIYDKINVIDTIKANSSPLSQYANSRVYMNLYNGLSNIFSNAKTLEDWYNIVFNLKTASGYGLDIWGNILNQGRQFSYDDNGTTVYVFLGGEQTIDGITYSAEYMEGMYRMVLFLKALTHITNCTLASLNSLLQYYFKDRIDPENNQNVYVINYGTMAIRYVFQFYVSKIEQSIFTSDVMPRPTGVLANFEFVPYGQYFGFFVEGEETQPYTPFDNKPFFR